ncbi:STAS domain-containing protein [Actinophytocola sp.]|uniref:STAS domain-containing protein n=1 Tax=Actinophytocola sp. TaxID=1872138 RepID=UPI00389ADA82
MTMAFEAKLDVEDGVATVQMSGELDSRSAPRLHELIMDAVARRVRRMVLLVGELTYLSSAGLRCLVFAHQKLERGADIVLVGTQPEVAETIRLTGFDRAILMQETTEP